MNTKKKWDSILNFTQQMQLIVLSAILVAVCAVLVKTYSEVIKTSEHSKALTNAVQISRNTAEYYSSYKSLDAILKGYSADGFTVSDSTVFFSEDISPASEEDAEYMAELREKNDGKLNTLTVTVFLTETSEEIYSLNVSVYDGGAGT